MKLKSLTAAGAALAVLALPSAAAAHSDPDYRDVRSHVRTADRSLDRVTRLVDAGRIDEVARELLKHRRHIRAAVKDAGGALRDADSTRDLRRVALAHRIVARQQAVNSAGYTQLLDDVTGSSQLRLARVLNASLSEREDVLNQLTALLDELPVGSQAGVSRWIRHLTNDGQAQVGALLGLLTEGSFPPDVQDQLSRALELSTGAVEEAVARLEGMVGMLPPQAQEPVRMAIVQVRDSLTMVRGLLEGLVGSLPALSPGQVPALPDLGSLLPGLENVLPGLGGTLPGSGQVAGNLANVLPALQGLLPGLGDLLGDLPGAGGGAPAVGGVPGAGEVPAAGDIIDQVTELAPGVGDVLNGLLGALPVPDSGTDDGSGGSLPVTDDGPAQDVINDLLGGLLGGLL